MKMTKELQKQWNDFRAEFATLCRQFGGERNESAELAGPDSAFTIPTRWGNLLASIHDPSQPWPDYSSAEIFLRFRDNSGPCPFPLRGEFNIYSHKWNIHRSIAEPRRYLDCYNEALSELYRRLMDATAGISKRMEKIFRVMVPHHKKRGVNVVYPWGTSPLYTALEAVRVMKSFGRKCRLRVEPGHKLEIWAESPHCRFTLQDWLDDFAGVRSDYLEAA